MDTKEQKKDFAIPNCCHTQVPITGARGTHKNQILAISSMEHLAFEGMLHYTLNTIMLSVPYHQC
jgi:hypothetical protein